VPNIVEKKTQPKARHIPQRTCVSCRETAAKRGLIRVVRTPEGVVEVDETGKKAGRGAYLCRRWECWQEAIRRERLATALRVKLLEADKDALRAYAEELLKAASPAP
jgi:predicted RNA-binding protein YlxR (DUF448 family)